jgi:hypothetical protein
VEVRFEFSDEVGAHHAEKPPVAESENPLISTHSADVVIGLHATCISVAECRQVLSLSSQHESCVFSGKNRSFLFFGARLESVSRGAGAGYERARSASQCLRTSTLFNTPLFNHRRVAQKFRRS